jgi:hypothetical protein
VGGAHGEIVGTTLSGDGFVELSGFGDYVELPGRIMSEMRNATVESWLVWHGGDSGQRVFEFGEQNSFGGGFGGGSNSPNSYVFFTPRSADTAPYGLTASWSTSGLNDANYLRTGQDTPTNVAAHLVLVFDDSDNRIRIYLDGELLDDASMFTQLGSFEDDRYFIGHSLFSDIPDLDGIFDEFRIYDVALDQAEIRQSHELGPDATFSAPSAADPDDSDDNDDGTPGLFGGGIAP